MTDETEFERCDGWVVVASRVRRRCILPAGHDGAHETLLGPGAQP